MILIKIARLFLNMMHVQPLNAKQTQSRIEVIRYFVKKWLCEENAKHLWELVVEAANDERNVTVIIENDSNEIIGFFWTMINEIYSNIFCMQINDIYIEENYRQHGIAHDIFCYAENHASKHNIKVMRSGTVGGYDSVFVIPFEKYQLLNQPIYYLLQYF